MVSFAHFWSGLQLTFEEGIKKQILDEETLPKAHEVAGRVKTMAELLMDCMSFQDEVASLLADLNIDGQSSSPPKPG